MIRRLGGVFDSRRLGYISTLCAARVPKEKITLLSNFLLKILGVTHNYLRNHYYNMWFTVIASSQGEVDQILSRVREVLDSGEVYSLPAIKVFKMRVDFHFEGDSSISQQVNSRNKYKVAYPWDGELLPVYELKEKDKSLVRTLQLNVPSSLRPFQDIAVKLELSEEQIITRINELLDARVIRRFGAVLRHQKVGYTTNAMGVWAVSEEKVEEAGKKMAMFREVSHCYQRFTLPDWPYNLFTMIHGHSAEQCKKTMEKVAQTTGLTQHSMLSSIAELKKTSMLYFVE